MWRWSFSGVRELGDNSKPPRLMKQRNPATRCAKKHSYEWTWRQKTNQWGQIWLSPARGQGITLSPVQLRAIIYESLVENPRDNVIVRCWAHNNVIPRFSPKYDLTDLWNQSNKEVKSQDSTTWFRVWQFQTRVKIGTFKCISWLNGLFSGEVDRYFLKERVKTCQMVPMSPFNSPAFSCLHLYSLWDERHGFDMTQKPAAIVQIVF
jgi:hypothetical protein